MFINRLVLSRKSIPGSTGSTRSNKASAIPKPQPTPPIPSPPGNKRNCKEARIRDPDDKTGSSQSNQGRKTVEGGAELPLGHAAKFKSR